MGDYIDPAEGDYMPDGSDYQGWDVEPTIESTLEQQLRAQAEDIYWHEGFRGDVLEEMVQQDINYRLENL